MNNVRAIKAIIQDPKFSAIENFMLEMRDDWFEEARKDMPDIETSGMNTIKFNAKAKAVDELLEALYETAGSELREKVNKIKDKDYE